MTDLRDTISELHKAVEASMLASMKVKKTGNIVAIGQYYTEIHECHKLMEDLTKILGSIKTEYSRTVLPDLMYDSKIPFIGVGGKKLTLNAKLRASIPQHKMNDGYNWLIETGYGDIIKPTVNPQTLSSAMAAYVDQKGMLPPEDKVSTFIEKNISIRKG